MSDETKKQSFSQKQLQQPSDDVYNQLNTPQVYSDSQLQGGGEEDKDDSFLKKYWIWIVSIFLTLFLLSIGGFLLFTNIVNSPADSESTTLLGKASSIDVESQTITSTVKIKSVRVVGSNAFLAVRVPNAGTTEHPDLLIAASTVLIPDTYEDIELPVYTHLSEERLNKAREVGRAYATLYRDVDEDGIFNPDKDTQIFKSVSGEDLKVFFDIDLNVQG